jgi:hypothetical protein
MRVEWLAAGLGCRPILTWSARSTTVITESLESNDQAAQAVLQAWGMEIY